MKKIVFVLAFITFGFGIAKAYEFPGFEWSVGTDVTSAYLFRGLKYGGLAVQPEVAIGYGGLKLSAWANISAEDYTFSTFAPELDVTLSYSIAGLTIGFNHLHYFNGTKYFDFSNSTFEQYENDDYNSNQSEIYIEYNLGEILEKIPLHIGWYTYIAGDDMYDVVQTVDGKETTVMKRAYSSYIDIAYDINLPLGFTLTPTIGMTPWKSCYTYYEGDFAVNNVSLKLNWEFEVGDHFCLDIYAQGMINTYGITKANLIPEISNSYNNQRLNGAIGIGLWFY